MTNVEIVEGLEQYVLRIKTQLRPYLANGYLKNHPYVVVEKKAITTIQAAIAALSVPVSVEEAVADSARVIEWAREKNRRPANSAFTAGPERQAAYWIEWAESELKGTSHGR